MRLVGYLKRNLLRTMNVKFISNYILGQYSNTVPSECVRKLLPVYSPCRVIVLIISDMVMLVMVIIGGDVMIFQT